MKTNYQSMKTLMAAIGLFMLSAYAYGQQPAIQYFRYYDKRGINVFETSRQIPFPTMV
jgi:hypothetical protein